MKQTLQRGFTLIELLVVIAIIGILASVVLASLNDARSSGADAAIQQSLANARSQAEIVYNANGAFSYEGVCENTKIQSLMTGALDSAGLSAALNVTDTVASDNTTVTCHDSGTAWGIIAPLAGTTTASWCVDSTGVAGRSVSAGLPASDYTCP